MSNQAEIISIAELEGSQIGGKEEERVKSDQELKDALEGKSGNEDLLGLNDLGDKSTENVVVDNQINTDNIDNENVDNSDTTVENQITDVNEQGEAERVSNVYKHTLKLMYGGDLGSVIEVDENGNEVEVSLESKLIDEAYFNLLVQENQKAIEESASEGKVSVQGASKFALDLLEIDKKGGNISDLIKVKETYTDPLDALDLDNPLDQEKAVYLRLMAGGNDHDTATRLIASFKQDNILEDKARVSAEELRNAVANQVEKAKKDAEDKAEQQRKVLKEYRKEIKSSLDRYELNDNFKSKIVKLATDVDEDGRLLVDELYFRLRTNPENAADFTLFLADKDEFIKQVTNSAVQNTKLETAKKLIRIPTNKDGGSTIADSGANKGSKDFISISSLEEQ